MKYTEKKASAYKVNLDGTTVMDRLSKLIGDAIKKVFEYLAKTFRAVSDSFTALANPNPYTVKGIAC